MNEQVKEILDRLNNIPMGELYACCLEDSECKIILDYITNLQNENEDLKDRLKVMKHFKNSLLEENEKLKELCDKYEEEHSNEFKIWKNERHQILDYKTRCEKAIEFIKEEAGYDEEIRSCCCDLLYSDCDKLIELLSGDE